MKPPIFIVGDNPLDRSPGRIFITHTREPMFVAEVFHFDIMDEESQMEAKQTFTIASSLEYHDEYIVIGVREMIATKKHSANQLAKLISRTGDWYYELISFEDNKQ